MYIAIVWLWVIASIKQSHREPQYFTKLYEAFRPGSRGSRGYGVAFLVAKLLYKSKCPYVNHV